jgi:hypothetical protein
MKKWYTASALRLQGLPKNHENQHRHFQLTNSRPILRRSVLILSSHFVGRIFSKPYNAWTFGHDHSGLKSKNIISKTGEIGALKLRGTQWDMG